MFWKELSKRILQHISSLSLMLIVVVLYSFEQQAWLEAYLPLNGQLLFGFTSFGLIAVHEFNFASHKTLGGKVDNLSLDMKTSRLVHSVNALYGRFEDSGDEWITNEYTIKELADLTDIRNELGTNSYVQGRLNYLNDKIKRG